jgi:hypothetical protein
MIDPRPLAREFATVDLGDQRLDRRAAHCITALASRPAAGFPKVLTVAELEGYYRFVNNGKVTFEALLNAHVDASKARMRAAERIVVAEDSTDFRFSDEVPREGLGPMDNGGQGFYAHFALAIAGPQHPLGVVGVETWVRTAKTAESKQTQAQRYGAADKESLRWPRMVEEVERVLAGGPVIVHVMDREADDYDLLAHMVGNGRHFVIRSSTDRRLCGEPGDDKLKAFVRSLEVVCGREAKLSNRPKKGRPAKERKKFPARKQRLAQLTFSSEHVRIRRPDRANKGLPEQVELNVVYVNEPHPPEGCEPVEWILFTGEPVDTEEQVLQVVDDYRQRWLIEEYFKALKSGCAFEQRQHETRTALLNALAIFIPIAWSLLSLRTLARSAQHADDPASQVLTPAQLQILRAKSERKLPDNLTIREAMLGIARFFGGHLKSNGEPGWQVLGRGYQELLLAEMYWNLALANAAR